MAREGYWTWRAAGATRASRRRTSPGGWRRRRAVRRVGRASTATRTPATAPATARWRSTRGPGSARRSPRPLLGAPARRGRRRRWRWARSRSRRCGRACAAADEGRRRRRRASAAWPPRCAWRTPGTRSSCSSRRDAPGGKARAPRAGGGFRFDTGPSLLTMPWVLRGPLRRHGRAGRAAARARPRRARDALPLRRRQRASTLSADLPPRVRGARGLVARARAPTGCASWARAPRCGARRGRS